MVPICFIITLDQVGVSYPYTEKDNLEEEWPPV